MLIYPEFSIETDPCNSLIKDLSWPLEQRVRLLSQYLQFVRHIKSLTCHCDRKQSPIAPEARCLQVCWVCSALEALPGSYRNYLILNSVLNPASSMLSQSVCLICTPSDLDKRILPPKKTAELWQQEEILTTKFKTWNHYSCSHHLPKLATQCLWGFSWSKYTMDLASLTGDFLCI